MVWTAPLSVVKVLFLANRYLTPAFTILHLWSAFIYEEINFRTEHTLAFSGLAVGLNDTVRTSILGQTPSFS